MINRDSGTGGDYKLPSAFSSQAYARYQPTHDDEISEFGRLVRQWRFETLTESSIDVALSNEAFKRIVEIGQPAVPLIVEEIKTRPDLLVAALTLITGEDPVRPDERGNMVSMATGWIDWYDRNRGRFS